MRLTFTLYDVQEISSAAVRAFVATFKVTEDEDYESELLDSNNSDSDLDEFDSTQFGCGPITSEIEEMVDNTWELCDPIDHVYGPMTKVVKETVLNAKEESQCAGLHFIGDIASSEDRNLVKTCTVIAYWCCCETIKRVSPILAEATTNLMY